MWVDMMQFTLKDIMISVEDCVNSCETNMLIGTNITLNDKKKQMKFLKQLR